MMMHVTFLSTGPNELMKPLSSSSLSESKDERELSALAALSQRGDHEAYRLFLRRVDGLVQTFAANSLRRFGCSDEEASRDIAQDILLAIHSKRATYDPGRFFLPWMYAIARYKVIDWLRGQRLLRGTFVSEGDIEFVSSAHVENDSIDAAGLDVESVLASLPEKQENVLREVKINGLSMREASHKLGISESDVKVSVHRAMKSLKEIFQK